MGTLNLLISYILAYESNDFSASRSEITPHEATVIAKKLAERFIDLQTSYLDGEMLTEMLSWLREDGTL